MITTLKLNSNLKSVISDYDFEFFLSGQNCSHIIDIAWMQSSFICKYFFLNGLFLVKQATLQKNLTAS